jgi:hypothetical protein
MIAIVRAWWAVLLRGFAAIAIALVVLVQAHVSPTMVALLLGGYVLVDSVVAVCGAVGAGMSTYGGALLMQGLIGILVTVAIFSSMRLTPSPPHTTQNLIGAWALVVGLAELYTGLRVGREMPTLRTNYPRRYRRVLNPTPPAREYLLSGAAALAFALMLLGLSEMRKGIAIPILGLFAATFGYLHVRSGLNLAIFRCEPFWMEGATRTMYRGIPGTMLRSGYHD